MGYGSRAGCGGRPQLSPARCTQGEAEGGGAWEGAWPASLAQPFLTSEIREGGGDRKASDAVSAVGPGRLWRALGRVEGLSRLGPAPLWHRDTPANSGRRLGCGMHCPCVLGGNLVSWSNLALSAGEGGEPMAVTSSGSAAGPFPEDGSHLLLSGCMFIPCCPLSLASPQARVAGAVTSDSPQVRRGVRGFPGCPMLRWVVFPPCSALLGPPSFSTGPRARGLAGCFQEGL